MKRWACAGCVAVGVAVSSGALRAEGALSVLPAENGKVEMDVQDGPSQPVRKLTFEVVYPKGKFAQVSKTTGLMLTLHNWGGTLWDNTPRPATLADTYDVIAIGVTYYQSGDSPRAAEPYDFGYLQAMDALRALHHVAQSLKAANHPFDPTRLYCTGGSGGGNVTQMANKFAPNTFACIVDLSGMASLTDDIAYNLPGGSTLNARYSREPESPAYLSPDMQEIRDLGNPAHLALQSKTENRVKIVVIHGEDDGSCLAADKRRVVEAMQAAGLDVDAHFIAKADVDGKTVINSGHQIGDRTQLLMRFAGKYLSPGSADLCRLKHPSDLDRRGVIEYPTRTGVHTISYEAAQPTLTFMPAQAARTP